MERINCDIIQDLIPSYTDNVCSAATRNCVEEHIKDCAKCREILAVCQNSALSGIQAEQAVLNGFAKLKKKMKYQLIVNTVLIILVCLYIQRFLYNTSYLLLSFSVLLTVGILAGLLVTADRHIAEHPRKGGYAIGIFSLFISVGNALLYYYVIKKTLSGAASVFFGLEARQCGPLLGKLFFAAFIMQLACFLYCFLSSSAGLPFRHANNLSSDTAYGAKCTRMRAASSCLTVTGIFLSSVYSALLHRLDTPESFFRIFNQINVISVIVCILGIFAGSHFFIKKFKVSTFRNIC